MGYNHLLRSYVPEGTDLLVWRVDALSAVANCSVIEEKNVAELECQPSHDCHETHDGQEASVFCRVSFKAVECWADSCRVHIDLFKEDWTLSFFFGGHLDLN